MMVRLLSLALWVGQQSILLQIRKVYVVENSSKSIVSSGHVMFYEKVFFTTTVIHRRFLDILVIHFDPTPVHMRSC